MFFDCYGQKAMDSLMDFDIIYRHAIIYALRFHFFHCQISWLNDLEKFKFEI